jgi:hypothetical protein
MRRLAQSTSAIFAALLTGCCAIYPCHPGLSVHGLVVSEDTHKPINGISIGLFGTKVTCPSNEFRIHLSSALPLTLSVSASGYKPIEAPAKFGYYQARVVLAPNQTNGASTVEWVEISELEFGRAQGCGL